MALAVRPSPIHSVGVYTSTPIRKKTRVVEYDGERITAEEADRRYNGVSRTYLYGLDDGKTVIDGHGLGAYLNHSCDPNCEVDEIKGRVWIFAIRDIAAGEELLWDYNLYDDEDPAPCHCGSPKCRGTMYSRERMAKLRRREARKKKKLESAEIGKSATRDSTTRKGATVKSTTAKGTTVDNMTGKGTTSSRADSVPLDEAGFSR